MHDGTRFALYDYALEGDGIELLSAYSAAEGRLLLETTPDIAVILLDVVMETDRAGLELVDASVAISATRPCASSCAPANRGRRRSAR